MNYYCINTDSGHDVVRRDVWFDRNMAFAGDCAHEKWKHSTLFKRLEFGDVFFAYHSGVGFDAVGVVDEERWSGECFEGSQRHLYKGDLVVFEYRIRVCWVKDWRSKPQPAKTLGLPVTPYYFCKIDPSRYEVKQLFATLSKKKG